MLFGKYKFECRFETEAFLPRYKGSTFRGAFGWALKQVVCVGRNSACSNCLVKDQCLYVQVFETQLCKTLPKSSRMAAPPHPFVIEPSADTATHYKAGNRFDFNLLLFGDANRHLPYFIYTFERMGRTGIGKKIDGKRGRFVLKTVKHEGNVIYAQETQRIDMAEDFPRLALNTPIKSNGNSRQLTLTLKTPLRLKFKNRFVAELPFHLLVRAMNRRIYSLMSFYAGGEPPLDYKGLIDRAREVRVASSDLKWYDWHRYSQRQNRKMLMGGLTGAVTYQGPLKEFLPLIAFCEKAHIGKQTAFGLGQITSGNGNT